MLEGRRALVTGARTSIGREVTLELARQGADVIVRYWGDDAEGESAAAEIRDLGHKTDLIKADLRDVESCFKVVDFAAERMGRFGQDMNDVNGSKSLKIAPSLDGEISSLRYYNRYLRTSEAISNFQAGRESDK